MSLQSNTTLNRPESNWRQGKYQPTKGIDMEDMKVAQEYLDPEWWTNKLPSGYTLQNWIISQACFDHEHACEYLLYIGEGVKIDTWPEQLRPSALEAKSSGFKYICYHCS